MYDKNNVFAKIIRGEIPCNKIYENEHAMSFYDVNPMFSQHALIIPKGEYQDILDFASNASVAEQSAFWDCFTQTANILGIDCNFNCLANAGVGAPFVKQSVFHFHLHLVAGNRTDAFEQLIEELQ